MGKPSIYQKQLQIFLFLMVALALAVVANANTIIADKVGSGDFHPEKFVVMDTRDYEVACTDRAGKKTGVIAKADGCLVMLKKREGDAYFETYEKPPCRMKVGQVVNLVIGKTLHQRFPIVLCEGKKVSSESMRHPERLRFNIWKTYSDEEVARLKKLNAKPEETKEK